MIGGHDRYCPRCGAGLCSYNAGPFCWPCTERAGEGFAWHWSEVRAAWIRIPVLRLEPPWEPEPGDVVLGGLFEPEPRRRRDKWDKWRGIAETANA